MKFNLEQQQTYQFYSLLGLSLLFFLWKGIRYALIGSYLPLYIGAGASLIVFFSYFISSKLFSITVKVWALFLMFWAIGFIFIEVAFQFSSEVTEAHIRDQFTIVRNLIAFLALFVGIFFFRFLRKEKKRKIIASDNS